MVHFPRSIVRPEIQCYSVREFDQMAHCSAQP
jgi:hypothetical protein